MKLKKIEIRAEIGGKTEHIIRSNNPLECLYYTDKRDDQNKHGGKRQKNARNMAGNES